MSSREVDWFSPPGPVPVHDGGDATREATTRRVGGAGRRRGGLQMHSAVWLCTCSLQYIPHASYIFFYYTIPLIPTLLDVLNLKWAL